MEKRVSDALYDRNFYGTSQNLHGETCINGVPSSLTDSRRDCNLTQQALAVSGSFDSSQRSRRVLKVDTNPHFFNNRSHNTSIATMLEAETSEYHKKKELI